MKNLNKIYFLAVFFLLFQSSLFAANKSYLADLKTSTLTWEGEKPTGTHKGSVSFIKASLKMDGGNLTGGEFEIDMNSISCTDIKDPKYNQKLVNHLKSDDFFEVSKHKWAKLKIKDVQLGKGGKYDVFSELTIRGITKPVMFEATLEDKKGKRIFSTSFKVNRLDWGIKYKSKSIFAKIGDKFIYDDFTLNVDIVLSSRKL
jgi:polyisoprenoid-binding protein YceI